MPPPNDGNERLPFERLIQVERLADDTFQSVALPFHPGGVGGGHNAAYGGHVYMQAAWAASLTVDEGFLLSNVTGHFLLPALPTVRYVYRVQKIRDGRSYCTRAVHVTQREDQGFMFTGTCVFKRAESSPIDVQTPPEVLAATYAAVLDGKRPHEFPEPASVDVPSYWERQRQRRAAGDDDDDDDAGDFPGLDMRKVDMAAYNTARHPLERRQLLFYRARGALPPPPAAPNMHLCAHLYASDRNGLFFLANHFDLAAYAGIGSLVHQVVFHAGAETAGPAPVWALGQDAERGPADTEAWFCKEDWAERFAHGRVLLRARLWAPDGTHVASIVQDGMLRTPRGKDGEMRELARRWPRPTTATASIMSTTPMADEPRVEEREKRAEKL